MIKFFLLGIFLVFHNINFAQPLILARSDMHVSSATGDFERLKNALVILGSSDGINPTDIYIDYQISHVFLEINSISIDSQGCARFNAGLDSFNINLESDYGCEESRPWKATVRSSASTMELFGYPEYR